jgi:hypothetical protein
MRSVQPILTLLLLVSHISLQAYRQSGKPVEVQIKAGHRATSLMDTPCALLCSTQ